MCALPGHDYYLPEWLQPILQLTPPSWSSQSSAATLYGSEELK